MRLSILTLVPLGWGCAVYSPRSFHDLGTPFPGHRVSTACLDVGIARTQDAVAHGTIVEFSFGNRCAHAVTVDLASVRVRAGGILLHAHDPRREIEPLGLDAFWQGHELIEYNGADSGDVCVEIGGIEAGARNAERWVCLDTWSDA